MAKDVIYTNITHETVIGARDRVLDDLNLLTNGNADKAIAYVKEFLELDGILREIEKRQKWEEEAAAKAAAEAEKAAELDKLEGGVA